MHINVMSWGIQTKKFAYLAAALVIFTSSLTWIQIARAESDTTPMQLTNLVASTNSVDVDNSDVSVNIQSPMYDDLSGVQYVAFYYTSPSGNIVYEGDTGFSGNDGELFDSWIRFRQNAEPGVWRPTFITYDEAGNVEVLMADDLAASGFNLDITVVSTNPDLSPPVLTSLVNSTSTVDIDAGQTNLNLYTTIQDDILDDYDFQLRYISPSGNKTVIGYLYNTTGNNYETSVHFNEYSEGGNWSLYMSLCDRIGNCLSLAPNDLQGLGFPHQVAVTNTTGDSEAITINNVQFAAGDPAFDNVQIGGGGISILADLTDNLSGIGMVNLRYYSQTSTQIAEYDGMSEGPSSTEYYLNAVLPPYSATGLWLPEIESYDNAGNARTFKHADLLALGYDLSFTLSQTETGSVVDGGTLNTDTSGTGATPSTPVQTAVTSPIAGDVSVTALDLPQPVVTTNGYLLAGKQIHIHAPEASVEDPLNLVFTLDASEVPVGESAATIAIFKNGDIIEECIDSVTANPDPCIYSRVDLPDGDIELKVHTSYASVWTMAFPIVDNVLFDQFLSPINDSSEINSAQAGSAIPVKFRFGDNTELGILSEGSVTSQTIDCSTNELIGDITPITSIGGGLSSNGDNYRFNWKTQKNWNNSCRQLTLSFTNGEVATATFQF